MAPRIEWNINLKTKDKLIGKLKEAWTLMKYGWQWYLQSYIEFKISERNGNVCGCMKCLQIKKEK